MISIMLLTFPAKFIFLAVLYGSVCKYIEKEFLSNILAYFRLLCIFLELRVLLKGSGFLL